jgi:hypothetical protein
MLNLDQLLAVLNAATDRGTIRWEETADEDTFRTMLDFGMVQLSRRPQPPHYQIELFDQELRLLEEFRPSGEGSQLGIESLYKKVRQAVLNLDAKVQRLLEELKERAGVA